MVHLQWGVAGNQTSKMGGHVWAANFQRSEWISLCVGISVTTIDGINVCSSTEEVKVVDND